MSKDGKRVGSDLGCRGGGDSSECQNTVALAACRREAARFQRAAHSFGRAIRQHSGAVEPPGSVVIPKMMVFAADLLTI